MKKYVNEFIAINDRIAAMNLEIRKSNICVLQVHGPTQGVDLMKIGDFYKNLNEFINREINKNTALITPADMHSQIVNSEPGGG